MGVGHPMIIAKAVDALLQLLTKFDGLGAEPMVQCTNGIELVITKL